MNFPTLGRFGSSRDSLKPVTPGKHRDNEKPVIEEDDDLSGYLAALAPDELSTTISGRRFGEAQVYQLRLSLIASEQLKELAAARNTSPQRLAHDWVLERLSWELQPATGNFGQ